MVRTYVQKRRSTYFKMNLDAAVEKVQEEGISIGKASKQFKIPKETLRRWANTAPNPSQQTYFEAVHFLMFYKE